MYKLWATIVKDTRVLARDRVGLTLMFLMPVVLVLIITSLQDRTFKVINDHKIRLLLYNKDTGLAARQLVTTLSKSAMFEMQYAADTCSEQFVKEEMHRKDALVAITIPNTFSEQLRQKAKSISEKALNQFGVGKDSAVKGVNNATEAVGLYYHPVLQESFRASIRGTLQGALQIVESKQLLQAIYFTLNEKELPDALENDITNNRSTINEIPVVKNLNRGIPNASQHNVPAWTIFAMFFIVASLGSSVVKEITSGSFIRLKTLPTNYWVSLLSKQFVYISVCLLQILVIFSLGVWLFPLIKLPALNLPSDWLGLLLVSVVCAWCAVSYAICIGVFAKTQQQANGFGAVSVVIMAALGGVFVPAFAMPGSFQVVVRLSPLHWCLEAYYDLFLQGGTLYDALLNLCYIIVITVILQLLTFWGLRNKNLI